MKRAIAAALAFMTCAAIPQTTFGPAPAGAAQKVALRVIREAEHPCPKIARAQRERDGGIRARCSNGEDYIIAS